MLIYSEKSKYLFALKEITQGVTHVQVVIYQTAYTVYMLISCIYVSRPRLTPRQCEENVS
jgi:hypothetical protein